MRYIKTIFKKSKKILGLASLLAVIVFIALNASTWHGKYLFNKIGLVTVKVLHSEIEQAGGTGFHVKANSGNSYIVTNAHVCQAALSSSEREVLVTVPNSNRVIKRKVIEIYKNHDLCIIEPLAGKKGISVASSLNIGDKIRVIGHPRLRPLRESLGTFLEKTEVNLLVGIGLTEEMCSNRSGIIYKFFDIDLCVRKLKANETDVLIYPGNSGSATVNFWGNLVGIMFASNDMRNGYMVPLEDIKEFLRIY